MRTTAFLFLIAVLGWATPSIAGKGDAGGPSCCSNCGCQAACVKKTCQLVCDVKKEKKTYFCVECEEFCPLLPGHRDCCNDCEKTPRCGHTKCVKKLVKKEYEVEIPVYKCVVVYLCPDCAAGESPAPAADDAPAPSVPQQASPAPLPPAPKAKK